MPPYFLCKPRSKDLYSRISEVCVQLLYCNYTHISVLPLPGDTVGVTSACLIVIKLAS